MTKCRPPKFRIGDIFSGSYQYYGVHRETGRFTRFEDELSYTVLDANFAVDGNRRYQNVSFRNDYLGGTVVAGFYDRKTHTGIVLHESKQFEDADVIKISQVSLSENGDELTIQFSKNNGRSATEYEFYVFTAVLYIR